MAEIDPFLDRDARVIAEANGVIPPRTPEQRRADDLLGPTPSFRRTMGFVSQEVKVDGCPGGSHCCSGILLPYPVIREW